MRSTWSRRPNEPGERSPVANLVLLLTAILVISLFHRYQTILHESGQAAASGAAEPAAGVSREDRTGGGQLEHHRGPADFPPIDVNQASVEELVRLPGIGEKLARAIVEFREQHGPFRAKEDLQQVRGIGTKRLDAIAGLITVSGGPPGSPTVP